MPRDFQRVSSQPVPGPAPARDARPRPARLASVIGNRAMRRIAEGAIPAAQPDGIRALQRDTPKDERATHDQADPKAGWWVKFKGSHSDLGDWLPLGDFSLGKGTDTDDVTGFVDILVPSPKGLRLGRAFDDSEHLTLLIEQRSHDERPIRQPPQEVVITSLQWSTSKSKDSGGQDRLDTRVRIHVGLKIVGAPSESR